MATFVVDTFTEATGAPLLDAHTGETGATWTKHPNSGVGTATVPSAIDRARGATAGGMILYTASGSPGGADYDVEASFVFVTDTTAAFGVVGRASTSQTDHYLAWYDQNTDQWELWSVVAGAATLLGAYAQTLTTAAPYTMKLELRGTAIKVYVDGVERISVTDSSVTAAGKAGVRQRGGGTNTTGLHLDSISAADAGATTHTAAAAVTGAGAVAGTATRSAVVASALAGAGAVSASATRTVVVTAQVAGAGAVNGTAGVTRVGAAAVSGTGAVSVSATRTALVVGAVSGAGDITAAARLTGMASAAVSGTGTISATAIGGRRDFTYHGSPSANYGGTAVFSYDHDEDWTYTPVTG